MPSVRIETVIFDVDDVLCDYDRGARIARMAAATGLEPAAIVAAIWDSGFDERADAGEFDAVSYLAETNRRLGRTITAAEWAAARRAGMTPRPAVLEMAGRAGKMATLAALTNNGPLMRERMSDIFPEAAVLFGERLFFSWELGLAKPDPRAFLAVLERVGGRPESALFIDDDAGYLTGAAEAGLFTHQYTGEEALARQLADFGLL
jgi:FMN phosphatase YigB (HAD superfamily)